MPSGAKKRKAAKKKQEQASSTPTTTTQTNLKSNNHDSRSQVEKESIDGENYKKDERIEIIDSSHDHDKSSSSSSTSSSSSNSSDDESKEAKKRDDDNNNETVYEVITVPDQPVPMAGDAPFMGATANEVVENTGLIDSATHTSDLNSGQTIEILAVDTIISNEADEKPLSEITGEASLAIGQATSGVTDSYVKENKAKTSSLTESNGVPEGSRESETVVSHEEEAPALPAHGIAQKTSWFSCCGLFDVVTGSTR